MNPSEKDLDRETLEFEPPETIEEEQENLGENFGRAPNGPDDKAENIEIDDDDALFAEEQQRKQDFNRD